MPKYAVEFITHIKGQDIPSNFKLLSFDVTWLFTNVSLGFMVDVILKQIFNQNEIKYQHT